MQSLVTLVPMRFLVLMLVALLLPLPLTEQRELMQHQQMQK